MRAIRRTVAIAFAVAAVAACASATPRPRQADLDSWRNVPVIELESHPHFGVMSRDVHKLSDGSELWDYANCDSNDRCCHNVFRVSNGRVLSYEVSSVNTDCFTTCEHRPKSKACGSTPAHTAQEDGPSPEMRAFLADHAIDAGTPTNDPADTATGDKGGPVHVRGYTKSDGTYVAPYTRSAPHR